MIKAVTVSSCYALLRCKLEKFDEIMLDKIDMIKFSHLMVLHLIVLHFQISNERDKKDLKPHPRGGRAISRDDS